jgi:DNA repair protein RadC
MADKKYPHADHRRRVREAYRKSKPSEIPDRGLLELLLFYSIPRRDTNALAGTLLDKYGSLKGVLNAPFDELTQTDGIGESSALLLSVLPEISERLRKGESKTALFEQGEAEKYVTELFTNSVNEEFYMICLDAFGRAIGCVLLGEGDLTSVTIDKKDIIKAALDSDADSVILTHNHPSGEAAPSEKDIFLTCEICRLLREIGIKVTDHIIAGRDGCLSLRATYKFKELFD